MIDKTLIRMAQAELNAAQKSLGFTLDNLQRVLNEANPQQRLSDAQKLEIAWQALTHIGYVRGHEFGDAEILQAFETKGE